MNILQSIFNDHYEYILYAMHPRDTEIQNIDKMLACGDPSFGGAMYACFHCGNYKFVPFRCHSRFCPSCGHLYSIIKYIERYLGRPPRFSPFPDSFIYGTVEFTLCYGLHDCHIF